MERPPSQRSDSAGSAEEAPEVRVDASRVRCPFCHSATEPDQGWVACASCLARHHDACWGEGRRCATCGHEEHLVAPGARPLTVVGDPYAGQDDVRRFVWGVLVSFVLLVGAGAAIGYGVAGPLGALVGAGVGLLILVQLGGVLL